MAKQKQETLPIYCDDCVAVKQWAVARPYVNVRLCRKHAAAPDLLSAAKAALDWLTKPATYPAEFVRIKKQLESAIARAEQPDTEEE